MKSIVLSALIGVSGLALAEADVVTHQLDDKVSFQAVSWLGNQVVGSGTAGGIFASDDNGQHWQQIAGPAGSESLQFRDNQRLDNGRLLVMSAGEGADSGIFITDDNGAHWQRVSQGLNPTTFYDCLHMVDTQQGWLYGDSDEQGLFVLATQDGGEHWQRESIGVSAQAHEGGFASSGTCLSGYAERGVVAGTGNSDVARVLLYSNGSWQGIVSPLPGGEAGGIFSVQSHNDTLFVSGGSLKQAERPAQAWLYTLSDNTWTPLPVLPFTGAVYGSAVLPVAEGVEYWVSNPQGVAVLTPGSLSWQVVSESNIWSIACQPEKGCIGAGKNGRIEVYR